jgi:hypothetical protein
MATRSGQLSQTAVPGGSLTDESDGTEVDKYSQHLARG